MQKHERGQAMLKCLLLCSFLLVLVEGQSLAELYKCKNAQGSTVYTDNLTNAPRDCVTEQIITLPALNVVPARVASPANQSNRVLPVAPSDSSEHPESEEVSFSSFKSEAESLAQSFDSAHKGALRSTLLKEKQRARRQLPEIRAQKKDLLSRMEGSSLLLSQKKEISGILSAITE